MLETLIHWAGGALVVLGAMAGLGVLLFVLLPIVMFGLMGSFSEILGVVPAGTTEQGFRDAFKRLVGKGNTPPHTGGES
jgi:hypothetical protein